MLLRRITKHVKEQNWFAVILDFLIVVVGVFMAFQVQNWTAEHERGQLEASYVARLHEEVVMLQNSRAIILPAREKWARGLISASQVIFSKEDRDLTTLECESIVHSYIVTNPTDDLASLIELQGSGQLALFRNAQVSQALRQYLLIRSRARDANAGVESYIGNLSTKYSQLIRVVSGAPFAAIAAIYECDINGMRTDQAFLNDFQNTTANHANHVVGNTNVNNGLATLHQVLDEVLGLLHKEEIK